MVEFEVKSLLLQEGTKPSTDLNSRESNWLQRSNSEGVVVAVEDAAEEAAAADEEGREAITAFSRRRKIPNVSRMCLKIAILQDWTRFVAYNGGQKEV